MGRAGRGRSRSRRKRDGRHASHVCSVIGWASRTSFSSSAATVASRSSHTKVELVPRRLCRMNRQFGGRQGEDEPAVTRIHEGEVERVPEGRRAPPRRPGWNTMAWTPLIMCSPFSSPITRGVSSRRVVSGGDAAGLTGGTVTLRGPSSVESLDEEDRVPLVRALVGRTLLAGAFCVGRADSIDRARGGGGGSGC